VACNACNCCDPSCVAATFTNPTELGLGDVYCSDHYSTRYPINGISDLTVKACNGGSFGTDACDKWSANFSLAMKNWLSAGGMDWNLWAFVRIYIDVSGLPAGCRLEYTLVGSGGQNYGGGSVTNGNRWISWWCIYPGAELDITTWFRIKGCPTNGCCSASATVSNFKFALVCWSLPPDQCCCCFSDIFGRQCCGPSATYAVPNDDGGYYCDGQPADCETDDPCGLVPPTSVSLPCYSTQGYNANQCVLTRNNSDPVCTCQDSALFHGWEDPSANYMGCFPEVDYVLYGNAHSNCCKDSGTNCDY